MDEQYWSDLGKRAVACEGWRWMPGMLCRIGSGQIRVHQAGAGLLYGADRVWSDDGVWPDLRDAATVGCLRAHVSKVGGGVDFVVRLGIAPMMDGVRGQWLVVDRVGRQIRHGGLRFGHGGDWMAEALVAALEALDAT